MRGRRLRRGCAAAGVLVVATSAGVLLSLVPAASASAVAKTVTCSSLSGNLNSSPVTFILGGCSGNTGGSGKAQGSTITWGNGHTTYLTSAAFTPSGKPRQGNCPAHSDKWTVADSVGGDNTGSIRVRGPVSAKVCILNQAPDPWSLAPGSVLTLR